MRPTPRFIRLTTYGAPLWFLMAVSPIGWLAPTAFLLTLLVLASLEARRLPGAGVFTIARRFPARFSFDADHEVTLEIRHDASDRLTIEIREGLPDALELTTELPELTLERGQQATLTYGVRALERGCHGYGPLHLRITSPTGLVARKLWIDRTDEIRVYPRFLGVEQYDLLARIDEREEAVRKPRLARGQGTDFESIRAYVPGEDPRAIDWKISARRGHLVSRNLQVERGQQLAVMIDAGRFMTEKIGEHARFEHALNATVMLSYVAQRRGDSISVSCFSNEIESFMPPTKGSMVMPLVLESLYRVQPRRIESDYWHVVGRVMEKLKRRSLVVMMTDILDVPGSSGLLRNLYRAARKHLVLCVVFVERAIEATAEGTPRDLAGAYLKASAAHMVLERRLALEQMRARGIRVLETTPEQLSPSLVRKYLEIRGANLL